MAIAGNEFSERIHGIRTSLRMINDANTDAEEKIEEIASVLDEITEILELMQDAFRSFGQQF